MTACILGLAYQNVFINISSQKTQSQQFYTTVNSKIFLISYLVQNKCSKASLYFFSNSFVKIEGNYCCAAPILCSLFKLILSATFGHKITFVAKTHQKLILQFGSHFNHIKFKFSEFFRAYHSLIYTRYESLSSGLKALTAKISLSLRDDQEIFCKKNQKKYGEEGHRSLMRICTMYKFTSSMLTKRSTIWATSPFCVVEGCFLTLQFFFACVGD